MTVTHGRFHFPSSPARSQPSRAGLVPEALRDIRCDARSGHDLNPARTLALLDHIDELERENRELRDSLRMDYRRKRDFAPEYLPDEEGE